MSDTMWGWCPTDRDGLHKRTAIGYEKVTEGPDFHSTDSGNVQITGHAYYRFFVVWVCQSCTKTWWVEDYPKINAPTQPVATA